MSVATLTATALKRTSDGLLVSGLLAAATALGDFFGNTGKEFLLVKNTGASAVVTISTPGTVDGQAIGERTVTVATNETRMIGPFPPSIYNDTSYDLVALTYSDATNLTVALVRLTPETN